MLLFVYLIVLIFLYYSNYIDLISSIILYLTVFFVFIWNWYVHKSYHTENHWLNKYEWFQNDKRIHFQHHENPETNYGIATHFTDVVLNTFDYGFPANKTLSK